MIYCKEHGFQSAKISTVVNVCSQNIIPELFPLAGDADSVFAFVFRLKVFHFVSLNALSCMASLQTVFEGRGLSPSAAHSIDKV